MKDSISLIIGDKNLSSWSMRPWLALKASEIPFKEIKIQLDTPQMDKQIARYSNAGTVPVLVHGKTKVWDFKTIQYSADCPWCFKE